MRLLLLLLFFVLTLHSSGVEVLESKYILDENRTYNLENVYSHRESFLPLSYSDATLGFSDDTCWIYFKLKNSSAQNSSNVIEFLYALHDYVYVLEYKDGLVIDEYLTGDLTQHSSRKLDVNSLVLPYEIKAGETKEFILKVDSKSNLSIGMNFHSKDEYLISTRYADIFLGVYYGAVLIMLMYNFILYLMIREKVYLHYVLFHLFFLFALLSSNGLAFTLLYPDTPEINRYFLPLAFILANYFSVVFSLSFLEVRRYNNYLHYYLKLILIGHFTLFVSLFIVGYPILETMLSFSLLSVVSLFLSGIYILVRYKSTASRFFVIAWSFILIGSLMEELQGLGILHMEFYISYASQIGAFVELVLLSIALAYRYNTLYKKLEKSEAEVRSLNIHLQEKVNAQTKNLTLLIQEMHHRVKNNFQFILTFLWAQKKLTKDEASLQAIEQTKQRIHAISSLHQLLKVSDTVSINIKNYIQGILDSYSVQESSIRYENNIQDVLLGYDEAVTLGLILNELITNSIKYAFDGVENPTIEVYFGKHKGDGNYLFTYSDNGVGFDTSKSHKNSGLGYDLIYEFANKNGAKILLSSQDGMKFQFMLKKNNVAYRSIDEN